MSAPGRSPLRQAVFLDRDGTVARYQEYCCRPEDFELLPDAAQAVRALNHTGFAVVVVTNQSAVGRGWLTVEGLAAIHEKMTRQLRDAGAWVDAIYVCPHHPDDGCACRKPRPGLLWQAAEELTVSLPQSYVIGDRLLDVRLGRAVGSTSILVRSGHAPEPADDVVADHEAATLSAAVAWLLARERFRSAASRSSQTAAYRTVMP